MLQSLPYKDRSSNVKTFPRDAEVMFDKLLSWRFSITNRLVSDLIEAT